MVDPGGSGTSLEADGWDKGQNLTLWGGAQRSQEPQTELSSDSMNTTSQMPMLASISAMAPSEFFGKSYSNQTGELRSSTVGLAVNLCMAGGWRPRPDSIYCLSAPLCSESRLDESEVKRFV